MRMFMRDLVIGIGVTTIAILSGCNNESPAAVLVRETIKAIAEENRDKFRANVASSRVARAEVGGLDFNNGDITNMRRCGEPTKFEVRNAKDPDGQEVEIVTAVWKEPCYQKMSGGMFDNTEFKVEQVNGERKIKAFSR